MTSDFETRLAAMADREEIRDLVRRERFARDQRRWQVMRDCFHPEAHIRTSWYDGNAVDYVPATQKLVEMSPYGKHWVFPGFIQMNGDKATVESPAAILSRITLNGVEADCHVYCRFFSRVERREGVWRLSSFVVLFERDTLQALDPTVPLPVDWDRIAKHRPTYRFIAIVQESRGFTVNPDLLGDDRPEALQAFHDEQDLWLNAQA